MILLPIHIVAGAAGIVSGFVALYTVKGARRHRRSGMVFVYAMLTMTILGTVMAAVRGIAPQSNVPAGLLTAYLVITGLVTVRPPAGWSRRLDVVLLLVVMAVALADLAFGFAALTSANTKAHWMAIPYSIFATVGLLASAGDVRMIRAGGLRSASRLARHLWLMSFALFIATFSLVVRPNVFPKPLRIPGLLALPVLAVLVTMFYWLWRLRSGRASRTAGVAGAADAHPIRRAVATVSAL